MSRITGYAETDSIAHTLESSNLSFVTTGADTRAVYVIGGHWIDYSMISFRWRLRGTDKQGMGVHRLQRFCLRLSEGVA